tara:strand:- start:7 stop:456 length:450 start_codon:yes stop_codon:yes gene_type:complete
MIKFFFVIVVLSFLSNCSYEPVLTKKNYNFSFEKINSIGETSINKLIKQKFDISNKEENKYDLFFETKKIREIIAVDKKGDPTIFSLKIYLEYKITKNGNEVLKKKLEKKVTYNNIDDKFELSKKEEDIIIYLSESLSDEILRSTQTID